MLEKNILTVQDHTFGLHPYFLPKSDTDSLPPAKGIIFAFLLVDALRFYARDEWAWQTKYPGAYARAFQRAAQLAEECSFKLEDDGKLANDLRGAARKFRKNWTERNAIEQAFLDARRRLIRDIRLIVDEILPLPSRKKYEITNKLCAYLLDRFKIKTHSDQDAQQLLSLVRKDRQRHEGRIMEGDGMVRPHLKNKITILTRYCFGNAQLDPCPDSRPTPLPSVRISSMPQELFPSYSFLPYLSFSDFYPSDLFTRY
jgi:hypothetical protein